MLNNNMISISVHIAIIVFYIPIFILFNSMGAGLAALIALISIILYVVVGYKFLEVPKTLLHSCFSVLSIPIISIIIWITEYGSGPQTGFYTLNFQGLFYLLFNAPFAPIMDEMTKGSYTHRWTLLYFSFLPSLLMTIGVELKRITK
jgi:hypothetical protein